jgi:uncharacterized protein (TIGR01777 family)
MSEHNTNKKGRNVTSVLITGGSGLIGRHLTSTLLAEGYKVSHLSRKTIKSGSVKSFIWDPEKGTADPAAFEGTDYIVHLAGANIGEKRWTKSRKREILQSRIRSAGFLFETIQSLGINLKGFISASASGIYGSETTEKVFNEKDPPAGDFLGSICKSWEESADLFEKAGIRTVKIRTGVVLEKSDSALSRLMMPGKFGFLVQIGRGNQYMPWIHISDLCNIYLKAIEDQAMSGVYNAVAPQQVTHVEFIHQLAKTMRVGVFPLPVPGFLLRGFLGEMSVVVLKGNKISSGKIRNTGYTFLFGDLKNALENIIRK